MRTAAADLGQRRIAVARGAGDKSLVLEDSRHEVADIGFVVDNGIGLPKENRNRLLEPYVTTREKGTGLGLAIVGRILEEHGGGIELHDASEKFPGARGAWMRLHFIDEHPASAEAPSFETSSSEAASPARAEVLSEH